MHISVCSKSNRVRTYLAASSTVGRHFDTFVLLLRLLAGSTDATWRSASEDFFFPGRINQRHYNSYSTFAQYLV